MLYFNTKYFGLRVGSAHRLLSFALFELCGGDQTDPETAGPETVLCHLPASVFGEPATDDVSMTTTTVRLDANPEYPERCPVRLFEAYCMQW